jgi:glyoxylase-like metal-dependent hydrolase (beta-lactamase superfamily II)
MTEPRDIQSLKVAAGWAGADRATLVVLATRLAAEQADGYPYFQELADARPDQALPLALAGFFQARLGDDLDAALAKLDKAAAVDLGLPQYFRGITLAALPPDLRRAEQAVADLEFVLAVRDQFPPTLIRAVHHGLAAAYATLGKDDLAAEAARRSGRGAGAPESPQSFSAFWANPDDGFRFTSPAIVRPAPEVQVARGYDFGDLAFVTTSDGVVAIDAGTTQERVKAALGDLDLPADHRISHLILTHAHFDHVGGTDALRGEDTRVIAQAGFPDELRQQQANTLPFRYFTGNGTSTFDGMVPDLLVGEPTPLTVGDTEFVLYPTPGGETDDALMVYLPASGLLFTGDVMMPYLGAPFFAEGSPEGLLETLRFIRELRPSTLVHGHTPLTELFTVESIDGLEAALGELYDQVLDDIRHGLTLAAILNRNHLPEVLREHPLAVVPFLVIREQFSTRLHHQHTGYWQPDGQGMEPHTAQEHAAALDLLAGGSDEPFATAATTLIARGDHALALEIAQSGLINHPASTTLAELRRSALLHLLARNQQLSPFKYLVYAELAEAEIAPVG